MMLEILKFVHVVCSAVGICVGARVVFGILTGRPLMRWPTVFLKCSLVASATGLLLPFQHFSPAHWAAISSVYVSGAAVLALRKYHLAGIWVLLFALSIVSVLYLNIFVVIAHIFAMWIPAQPKRPFVITELLAMLLFAGFGLFTVKRYRNLRVHAAVHLQVNGCN
jgi:hypothetical protein